jgi:polysaccharide deacetylase 2 family uncharacterized protein YibQ
VLIIFWGVVGGIALAGIGILQILGPPPARPVPAADIHHAEMAAKPPAPAMAQPTASAMGTGSNLAAGQPIPPPISGLLAPSVSNPAWLVPQIGSDGLTPMRAYAAAAPLAQNLAGTRPHVAILVAGIGDDDVASQESVTSLPAAVSLALTPYGQHTPDIATLARAAGHETLLAIPMQEADPATENAGNEALVMAGPITQDRPMLDWNLSRIEGYAGVTDAIGVTQGAGFMDNPNAKAWLLQEVADKGLFFIDARPTGPSPYAWNRTADIVIDPVQAPEKEAAQLAELAADAKLQGSAMGILLSPVPSAVQNLRSWLQTLNAQGITLVPVSALVQRPMDAYPAPAAAGASSP